MPRFQFWIADDYEEETETNGSNDDGIVSNHTNIFVDRMICESEDILLCIVKNIQMIDKTCVEGAY
jgi:hypothetical protein